MSSVSAIIVFQRAAKLGHYTRSVLYSSPACLSACLLAELPEEALIDFCENRYTVIRSVQPARTDQILGFHFYEHKTIGIERVQTCTR